MALNLHFNVDKSVVMRVGPRWNCCCAECNLNWFVNFEICR